MAKVTIEGVINSDVCARGEQHTVEMTARLRGLIDNRIVRVVVSHDEPKAVEVAEESAPKPRRRRRRAQDDE